MKFGKGIELCLSLLVLLLVGCANTATDTSADNAQPAVDPAPESAGGGNAAIQQASGPQFDPGAVIREMGKRRMKSGFSHESGVWIVYRVNISADKSKDKQQALALAEIRAKRSIGEWMNTVISKKSSTRSSRKTDGDEVVSTSVYHSLTKVNSEAFLRGVTFHSFMNGEDGSLDAFFYVTGKIMDRTAELEAQLRAAPPGVVRAVGFSIIADEKISPAKRQAVQSALRNAVEQVMGTTVIGQSQLMDNEKAKSKLITQTVGNVKQYRVVKEGRSGVSYQVIVNAEVDETSLLDNYAAIVRSMGNPPFIIRTQDPDLKFALKDFFAGLGFLVTEDANAAQFVVEADCRYLQVVDDYYGRGIQIDVGLTLFDAKSRQQLISLRNSPQLTSTYSGSFHQIRQSAAKKAFKTMKKTLHEKLNKVVMDWVLNGREVVVVFKNAADTSLDEILVQAVADVPCAKFQTRSRQGNTLVLHCSYVGPSSDFEEFLRERIKRDLPQGTIMPKTKRIELNALEFSF